MQATVRFRQQVVDDRIEVLDACQRHADFVRAQLAWRQEQHPDVALEMFETTPPTDAVCPYDGPTCEPSTCGRHDTLVASAVEDTQLTSTS